MRAAMEIKSCREYIKGLERYSVTFSHQNVIVWNFFPIWSWFIEFFGCSRERHNVNWEIRTIYVLFNSFNSFYCYFIAIALRMKMSEGDSLTLVITTTVNGIKKICLETKRNLHFRDGGGLCWKGGSTLIAMSRRCFFILWNIEIKIHKFSVLIAAHSFAVICLRLQIT